MICITRHMPLQLVQKLQRKKGSSIQNFTQPLHLVQQHIPLFHHGFILCVLETWTGGLDDAVHFFDGGVEAAMKRESSLVKGISRVGK